MILPIIAEAAAQALPTGGWELLLAILSIVMIDIVLAGDNAVVIAMAVRALPPSQRMVGILAGSGLAVALRVGLTFVAGQLLDVPYVKLVGGILILWIAIKLLAESGAAAAEGESANARSIWHAVWMITVADVTMSLDNVLAVAGASKGNFALLLFGLGLSIPLVVFASRVLSHFMDRYPVIILIGAAILGKIGGEMILGDPLIHERLGLHSRVLEIAFEGFFVALVLIAGGLWRKRRASEESP